MTDRIDSAIAGASAVQLRRLVSLANQDPQTTEAVVPRLADPSELAILLDQIGLAAAAHGEHLVSAVLDPETPLAELESVHQQARDLVKCAGDVTHRAAAELLYHATVAVAFTRFGANLAARPFAARRSLYERLADLLGSGPLEEIFRCIELSD